MKMTNTQRIRAIAENLCKEQGYLLFDVSMDKEHTGMYMRIYIDTERDGGISLDDCEHFHRAFQPLVEEFEYDFLEVSSPGADRPIRDCQDAERFAGSQVDVRLFKPLNGRKEICCQLVGMTDDMLLLSENSESFSVDRKSVAVVKLHPDLTGLDDMDEYQRESIE